MAQGKKTDRASRERVRLYQARQAVHERKIARRRRDNLIAIISALVVIVLAVAAQVAFFASDASDSPTGEPSASDDPQSSVPPTALSENRTWTGQLTLNDVDLQIELDGAAAPQAVAAFVQNTRDDYFVGKICHRLTNDGFYVLQCGSVDGTGAGDPDFAFGPIENAPEDNMYPEGTLAMARASNDAESNGRQFFVVYEDTVIPSDAAGGYTVFGRVTDGLDELKADITDAGVIPGSAPNDGAPVVPTTITRVAVE